MKNSGNPLTISVFGLGYVGCVTAACLAEDGHCVIGVDVSEIKLAALMEGRAPVEEPGLGELIRAAVQGGRLRVTQDVAAAVRDSAVSFVCVGTPSGETGRIDLSYVERVCEQIGRALATRAAGHVVVIRSTMVPGSMASLVTRTLEGCSGCKAGEHFGTVFNPEFLREGTAIKDYRHPPVVVIGTEQAFAAELMKRLYPVEETRRVVTSAAVAEMVKYTANAWHALKITFANEIGAVCRSLGLDSHAVMEIFVKDRQLNISESYLKPGFAFGGSCLPKDLRALTYYARHQDVELPVLESVNRSNQLLIENVFKRIVSAGVKRVGLYGLSFKPHTDDLRESPFVTLVERLLGKGVQVRILDDNIQVDKLTGANKAYIDRHLPHLVQYLVRDFGDLERFAELVILGHRTAAAAEWAVKRNGRPAILDLARVPELIGTPDYEGISW